MFIDICPAEKEMFASLSHRDGVQLIVSTCLNRYSWSLTIALRISITKISRSGAKIIKLLYERDEPEGYVARDLYILMKEVSWNPDRTVMNEIVHIYYLGVQKGQ
jgi:hypothetical protein